MWQEGDDVDDKHAWAVTNERSSRYVLLLSIVLAADGGRSQRLRELRGDPAVLRVPRRKNEDITSLAVSAPPRLSDSPHLAVSI